MKNGKERRKYLKDELVGSISDVLKAGGTFFEEEADKIVDMFIDCHERKGKHPLQTSFVGGSLRMRYRDNSGRISCQVASIFSNPVLKQALARRGFYLNIGLFSDSETLTLMKNFQKFVRSKGMATDHKSLSDLVKGTEFRKLYQPTKMFLYIGKNLNRSSSQIYLRLKAVYHSDNHKGRFTAAEDQVILKRGKELKNKGEWRRWRVIADEINR
jgi:hypothetical protein